MLVRDRRDVPGVREQARDETPPGRGEAVLPRRGEERVLLTLEEREVRVHARPRVFDKGLGHEGGDQLLTQRHLLDDRAGRHDVVGRSDRVNGPQVDLVLTGPTLVMRELHGNPHVLQHAHGTAAEVVGVPSGHVIEIARLVHGHHALRGDGLAQEVELDLGMHHDAESGVGGALDDTLQDSARIRGRRATVGHEHVAEHAGDGILVGAPRQQLERGGVGHEQHVGLKHAGQALDGRAIEANTLGESVLQLTRINRNRL